MCVLPYENRRDPDSALGLYYRHAGKVSFPRLAIAILLLAPSSIVVGAAWGYCNAKWFYLDILICIASSLSISVVSSYALRYAKVRHHIISFAIFLLTLSLCWYAAWGIWTYEVLARSLKGPIPFTVIDLVKKPWKLAKMVQLINENGTWSLGLKIGRGPRGESMEAREMITGGKLALFWVGESAFFWGLAGAGTFKYVRAKAFCERCQRWFDPPRLIAKVQAEPPLSLEARIELHDFNCLRDWNPHTIANRWVELSTESCGKCQSIFLLSLAQVGLNSNSRGQPVEFRTTLIRRLVITQEQLQMVTKLIAQQSNSSRFNPQIQSNGIRPFADGK